MNIYSEVPFVVIHIRIVLIDQIRIAEVSGTPFFPIRIFSGTRIESNIEEARRKEKERTAKDTNDIVMKILGVNIILIVH